MQLKYLIAAVIAAGALNVCAQDKADAERRKAAQELMSAVNFKDVLAASSRSMREAFPGFLEQSIRDSKELDDKQKERAFEEAAKMLGDLQKEFEAEMAKPETLQQLEDLSIDVYLKFFTAAELKEMVAFYTSPTGRKSTQVTPQLVGETMQRSMALLMPQARLAAQKVITKVTASKS